MKTASKATALQDGSYRMIASDHAIQSMRRDLINKGIDSVAGQAKVRGLERPFEADEDPDAGDDGSRGDTLVQ